VAEGTVALIPLRGGSKSIPRKNTLLIAGKPLCAWTVEAAAAAASIDRVYVSTDVPWIAEAVDALNLGVIVIDRPEEFATDQASTESVMMHFASIVPFEKLVTLQATSPLTTAAHLDAAMKRFEDEKLDSMLTAVRLKRFFWNPEGQPLNYDPLHRPRRQDFDGTMMENGAFYITRRSLLEKTQCRLGGRIGVFEMEPASAAELDEPEDWCNIEKLLLQRERGDVHASAKAMKMLIVDVDGTLTDGGMYYGPEGEALKRFDTRDAMGLNRLREAGIEVIIMTREASAISAARAKKLGIPCQIGVRDKLAAVSALAQERSIAMAQIGFIGDDLFDGPSMSAVGFDACPADAQPAIRQLCGFVATAAGGHGAVREICEFILDCRSRS